MHRSLSVGLLAGLFLGGIAMAQETAPAPDASAPPVADYDAGTVLATVNGVEITLGHAIVMRERLPEQYQSLPDEVLLNGIVDQLIDQTLLAAVASGSGAEDPLEVRLHLENERRGTLAAGIVQDRVGAPLDEAAVTAAYEASIAGFVPAQEFNASHILVETEDRAKELVAEIAGGADFADLAKANSSDPGSAPGGGMLGWFGTGQMVPEFEAAAAGLAAGEISAPVQTQFGWHVIRLNETRQTTPPPLTEVRAQIENGLRQERLTEEIDALRGEATIERSEGVVIPGAIRESDLLQN